MQKGNDESPYSMRFLLKVGEQNKKGRSVAQLARIYGISRGTVSKARAAYRAYQKGVRDAQNVNESLLKTR